VKHHLEQNLAYEERQLRDKVRDFAKASGVDLEAAKNWDVGDIGEAVKTVVEARRLAHGRKAYRRKEAPTLVRDEIEHLEWMAKQHPEALAGLKDATAKLTEMAERMEADKP
jgi:hypothetical protein